MKRKALKRECHFIETALREAERLNPAWHAPRYDHIRSGVTVEVMNTDFRKYHFGGSVALHHFTGVDLGDPHDHPGGFTTQIIKPYVEDIYTIREDGTWSVERVAREAGTSHFVPASTIHKIVALPEGDSLTLVRYDRHEQATRFYRFGHGVARRQWRQRVWAQVPDSRNSIGPVF